MLNNKSYIWISFIVLIFGIIIVPKIVDRFNNNKVVQADRLHKVDYVNTSASSKLEVVGIAPKFDLVNHENLKITNEVYRGKVYVLEFFFSTCPTICPKMNQSMLEIERKFFGNPNFGIVSITINPEVDTPEVLMNYRQVLGVKSSSWNFLTGKKEAIFQLSNKGFNLYAGENAKVNGGFEHSGLFALIDKNGMIRCRKDDFGNPIMYYDGLEKESVISLQQDIAILLKE